jgi:hypothetical protein
MQKEESKQQNKSNFNLLIARNWAWVRGSCQRRTTWRWSCESKLGRRWWRPAAWRRTHLLPAARTEAADPHRLPRGGAKAKVRGDGVSCRLRGPPWRSHARWRSASLGSSLPVTPVGVLAVDAVLAPPTRGRTMPPCHTSLA